MIVCSFLPATMEIAASCQPVTARPDEASGPRFGVILLHVPSGTLEPPHGFEKPGCWACSGRNGPGPAAFPDPPMAVSACPDSRHFLGPGRPLSDRGAG